GTIVPGVLTQNQIAKPARQKSADHGGKSNSEKIDAVIVRRKHPRENEDAQQPQQRRKDIGGQIDAGLPYQHSASSPAGTLVKARGARRVRVSSIAERMICT